jgi:NTP pyrophosphatase (non-canonical NTP hydrolase)
MLVSKMKNHIERRAKLEIQSIVIDYDKVLESLGILQEECAEVIQEISKIRRFGIDSVSHHTGASHAATLEMEIGDVLCLVDYLVEKEVISLNGLEVAKKAKKTKLQKWSKIYE